MLVKEKISNFDPTLEATRLVRLDLQRYGWTENDLKLARKLIEEHTSDIEGVKAAIKGRGRKVVLGKALERGIKKFEALYAAEPFRKQKPVLTLETREERRKKVSPTAPKLILWRPTLDSANLHTKFLLPTFQVSTPADSPIETITEVSTFESLAHEASRLHRERPSAPLIIAIEPCMEAYGATWSLISYFEDTLGEVPEKMFFIGIAQNRQNCKTVEESLLTQLRSHEKDYTSRFLGVVLRGKNERKLRRTIEALLQEKGLLTKT